jgi:hypothetical protein
MLSIEQQVSAESARQAPAEKLYPADRIRPTALETCRAELDGSNGEHSANRRRDICERHFVYGSWVGSENVRDLVALVFRQTKINSAQRHRLRENVSKYVNGRDSIECGMPSNP